MIVSRSSTSAWTNQRRVVGSRDQSPPITAHLVHLLRGPHLDREVLADEREEGRGEVHLPLLVHRHVHADQLLVGEPGSEGVNKIRGTQYAGKARGKVDKVISLGEGY